MTKQLINACKKKKSLYIKFYKNITNYNECKYKRYKNKLIANLRQSKKKYFSGLINMHSKNLNEIWKIIKTITYKNRQNISIPNLFKNADETPIGEHDIADALNNFFTNIGSNLSNRITPQCSSICDTLLNTNYNSMFLSETNVDEIITIVNKLTQ